MPARITGNVLEATLFGAAIEPDNLHIFKQLHRQRDSVGRLDVTPETPVRQIMRIRCRPFRLNSLKIHFDMAILDL